VKIREVAASATRNADFLRELVRMIDEQRTTAACARDRGAHHAGRTGAYDHDIEIHAVLAHEGRA
jgi:hypothetical protein